MKRLLKKAKDMNFNNILKENDDDLFGFLWQHNNNGVKITTDVDEIHEPGYAATYEEPGEASVNGNEYNGKIEVFRDQLQNALNIQITDEQWEELYDRIVEFEERLFNDENTNFEITENYYKKFNDRIIREVTQWEPTEAPEPDYDNYND